jgi:hypothetical protein
MKRAFFKLGRIFSVESKARNSYFKMTVDIQEWAKSEEDWSFGFDEAKDGLKDLDEQARGTAVTVTGLHPDVASQFALPTFEKSLETEVKARLLDALSRGLAVTLNQIPISAQPIQLLESSQLAPAFRSLTYSKEGEKAVKVKLYCGLGPSGETAQAGWHVFCNGRLVLKGDKESVTGWEGRRETIPAFHPQFNSFRGYGFFDSDDAGRLPWNTTKTDLDTDSPVFRAARLEMMALMRPVITFLNKLKEEKEEHVRAGRGPGPLEELVSEAKPETLEQVRTRNSFDMPKVRVKPKGPVVQRIQYDKPVDQVEVVKRALRAVSFKEVGERTFEYYYNAECRK